MPPRFPKKKGLYYLGKFDRSYDIKFIVTSCLKTEILNILIVVRDAIQKLRCVPSSKGGVLRQIFWYKDDKDLQNIL